MLRTFGIAGLLLLQLTQAATPAPDDAPITLHAYSNLVQLPVLVLSESRQRLPDPLSPDQFTLNIDGGPYFSPRHVRQQGTDAIRLVILLDVSPVTDQLLTTLAPALQELSSSLTDKDVVSLSILRGPILTQTQPAPFTLGWRNSLIRFAQQQFAPAPASLFPEAIGSPRLFNAVTVALGRFGASTSRRILLLITDGVDRGSTISIPDLSTLSTARGVTVFALRVLPASAMRRSANVLSRDTFIFARPGHDGVDPLATLTELTGGATIDMRSHALAEGIMYVIRLARERYILDFPMPSKLGEGIHPVDVRTRLKRLFVRVGGTSAPIPDPAVANDPNTVHSNHADDPPIGTRRVLQR